MGPPRLLLAPSQNLLELLLRQKKGGGKENRQILVTSYHPTIVVFPAVLAKVYVIASSVGFCTELHDHLVGPARATNETECEAVSY